MAALVLLDPVDATGPDPSTVLPDLARLNVPTAILGSGKSEFDCAPPESNYERFAEAVGQKDSTPRLVGVLRRAGHTQFVDNRKVLSVDVCTTGKDKDAAVREVALATASEWVEAALAPSSAPGVSCKRAAEALRGREFAASVEWRAS